MLAVGAGSLILILLTRKDISFSEFCLLNITQEIMEMKMC